METVWIVIGFTIVNVAWIIALNTGTLTIQSVEVTGTA